MKYAFICGELQGRRLEKAGFFSARTAEGNEKEEPRTDKRRERRAIRKKEAQEEHGKLEAKGGLR